jgi:hypothetical protein
MDASSSEGRFRGDHGGYGLDIRCNKGRLIDQLTHTAFWVCGMRELAGSTTEYFESPNFAATKVYAKGRGRLPNTQVQADVQTFMQGLCVVSSAAFKLPDLVANWKHLLVEDDGGGDERFAGRRAAAEALHDTFVCELVALGKAIEERNAGRARACARSFVCFDPMKWPL